MNNITCGLFILNTENKLLITLPTNNHIWSIPKGMMDDNDNNYFDTAKRELLEETAIDLDKISYVILKEFDFVKYPKKNKYLKSFVIKLKQDYNAPIVCNSMFEYKGRMIPENSDSKWVSLDDAKCLLHNTQKNILDEIKRISK